MLKIHKKIIYCIVIISWRNTCVLVGETLVWSQTLNIIYLDTLIQLRMHNIKQFYDVQF